MGPVLFIRPNELKLDSTNDLHVYEAVEPTQSGHVWGSLIYTVCQSDI